MSYSVYFFDEVKSDIKKAKEWYSKQKPGLEKRFATEIKICITKLQKQPTAYEVRYKNIRSVFTDVFPYAIHFFINDIKKEIIIIAILHQSRNPNTYHNR